MCNALNTWLTFVMWGWIIAGIVWALFGLDHLLRKLPF